MKSNLLTIFFTFLIFWGLNAQIESVGLIGEATPGGWSDETSMTQVDDSTWTLSITLTTGPVKFRANNDWAINWGSTDFPRGVGTQNGPNIPVFGGDYEITFNSNSGEYFFDVDSDISIIGSATPGGWGADTKLYRVDGDTNKYYITIDLLEGEAKFRTTGSWDVNWGSTDFPLGVGVQGGDNIPIPQTGTYDITFDKSSGAYEFKEKVDYQSIGIIGSATPGGWDAETPMMRMSSNPNMWRVVITFVEGDAKFRANNSWDLSWGNSDFPTGIGSSDNGPNIPIPAGEFIVTFNTETFEYNFIQIIEYDKMQLMGSATPGGWDNGVFMERDGEDKSVWKLRVTLIDGEAKFRADENWDINWGSESFPEGVGEQDGPNIPITPGDYFIDFNSTTGAYKFTAVVEYDRVSLVGKTGPFGDWPPADDDSKDLFLNKDAEDFNLWTYPSTTLTSFADTQDGGVKFRANADWGINWGAADFPAGTGTQNGPNIETVAGTYSITFRSDTSEYVFGDPSSTVQILDPAKIKIYPNPAKEFVNIELDNEVFSGMATFTVYDITGNQVLSTQLDVKNINILDVSALKNGNYILNIRNEKFLIGKNLVVIK